MNLNMMDLGDSKLSPFFSLLSDSWDLPEQFYTDLYAAGAFKVLTDFDNATIKVTVSVEKRKDFSEFVKQHDQFAQLLSANQLVILDLKEEDKIVSSNDDIDIAVSANPNCYQSGC